jgi:hypothetical protein
MVLIMNSMGRILTLLLVILLLTSLLMLTITPVNVQAVSKPSVPQFTVKFVDYSYNIPSTTTTTTDPFTGEKNTITQPGRYMKNHTIEITIKNQFFTPSTAENGMEHRLRYVVQFKGHYAEDWQVWGEVYQSDSQYTVLSKSVNYATGSKVDFRVETQIGHTEFVDNSLFIPYFVSDGSSGWSKVQTFTMPGTSSSTPSQTTNHHQPSATSDNNQPQLPDQLQPPSFVFHPSFLLWIGSLLFVGIVVAVVMVFLKRHLKTPNYNNPIN